MKTGMFIDLSKNVGICTFLR